MGIVGDAGAAGISGPTFGLGDGPGAEIGDEEGVAAGGRVIGDLAEADAAGAAVLDLDCADNQILCWAFAIFIMLGLLITSPLHQRGSRSP
jgi:hypothetical protein